MLDFKIECYHTRKLKETSSALKVSIIRVIYIQNICPHIIQYGYVFYMIQAKEYLDAHLHTTNLFSHVISCHHDCDESDSLKRCVAIDAELLFYCYH